MSTQPSAQLIGHWVASFSAHLPFSRMRQEHVQQLASVALERYTPPEGQILAPSDGPPAYLFFLRQGRVLGRRAGEEQTQQAFEIEAGSLFPVGAVLAQRPVRNAYTALEDCFCLLIPYSAVSELMQISPLWADFLNQRMLAFLEISRRRWREELQAQVQQQQTLEMPIAQLPVREPVSCHESASLHEVLSLMHTRRIGSVLLTKEDALSGILTRNDVIGRVTLAALPLDTPVSQVMSQPVLTISSHDSAFDAALMMSRHGLRHLPVMEQGRLVSIISERDLFDLQNQSIKHVSGTIFQARTQAQLQQAAEQIRSFAAHLMAQGVQSRPLTHLISQLNDHLTQRIIALALPRHGLSAQQMCWMALGSEGRGEQTVATDQDNALIFESEDHGRDQPRWLAFAMEVNHTLNACGYPLCPGGVMASNPECCLSGEQWRARFAHWIEHGSPQDLLSASVFFDFRAMAGRSEWLQQLGQQVRQQAMRTPRFIAQWVHNHLNASVPLNWHGGFDTRSEEGEEIVDIKLSGTALVVDAARILAFSQGIEAVGTVERLERACARVGIPVEEYQGWITAFDYLQTLRLRHQIGATAQLHKANWLPLSTLNQVDKRVLKASFSAIRSLQQRLKLDYVR